MPAETEPLRVPLAADPLRVSLAADPLRSRYSDMPNHPAYLIYVDDAWSARDMKIPTSVRNFSLVRCSIGLGRLRQNGV